jgi:hypothetical protein
MSVFGADLLEKRLGSEGFAEIQQIVIHCRMHENLRKIVTLDTPILDQDLGIEATQESKDWMQRVADVASARRV